MLTHDQEREVIRSYDLTEGAFFALTEGAKASLYAAMGKDDSLVNAAPDLLASLIIMVQPWGEIACNNDPYWVTAARTAISRATQS